MTNDNPAARLHSILILGKGIDKNINAKAAWKKILGIEKNDLESESLLMVKIGQLMVLPHETSLLITQYFPNQVSSFEYTLQRIHGAFNAQNLSGKWETFINYIDIHTTSTLSMIAALLDTQLNTKLIEKDTLSELSKQINDIIDKVVISDLSAEFKKFIFHYLNKIKTAISNYFISGALPILDAVEATIGHAVLDPQFKNELKESEIGKTIRVYLTDLANVVAVAGGAYGVVEFLQQNALPLLAS